MNIHKRLVSALFVLTAGLVWLISNHYVGVLIGYFQLSRKIGVGTEFMQHGLPLLLGLGTLIFMRMNQKIYRFCTDSMLELTKVSFPGPKEIRLGTIVVIITVLMAGTLLGLLDMAYNAIIKTIIGA